MDTRILCVFSALLLATIVSASDVNQRVNWQQLHAQMNNPGARMQGAMGRRMPYAGGSRRRARRMGLMLIGPNVCKEGGQKFCCHGWMRSKNENRCDQPYCHRDQCGQGVCIGPKQCLCENGIVGAICGKRGRFQDEAEQAEQCNMRCLNGGKCVDNKCECVNGYTGAYCGQPRCGPGCLNGGRCISPQKCACTYGFTGTHCERDYRIGPCFLTLTNESCTDQLENIMCTKRLCCATVGEAWGRPCEKCPVRVGNCTKGRFPPLCTDIDECDTIPGLCANGECVNTDGSFRCECPEGYRHDMRLHRCVDIDECQEGLCENGECTNTKGSFICECPQDYILSADGTYCIMDIPGYCFTSVESGMCSNALEKLVKRANCCCPVVNGETLGKCFAIPGNTPERCPALNTEEYIENCKGMSNDLMNMCNLLGQMACENGVCISGGIDDFHCKCNDGFEATPDHKTCIDINECLQSADPKNDVCGPHGTCMNTLGSYQCHCAPGFVVTEDNTCVDIDECSDRLDLCENGDCINTKGSFRCRCGNGYKPTATQQGCEDYNECLHSATLCENGRCVNVDGGFQCICNPGFAASEDLMSCGDEDECGTTGICQNGECVNRDGSFECICIDGYTLTPDGKQCKDVDECSKNPCANGRCENIPGGFNCVCHRFLVLDASGTRCILDPTLGSCFREVRDGQCTSVNALLKQTTRSACCCVAPGGTSAWGDSCEPCPDVGTANHGILCSGDQPFGNVCELMMNPCENGKCINEAGNTFSCICDNGFVPTRNNKGCKDVDECATACSNGVCRNTPGSYQCTCNEGYVLKGEVCEDQDECISNPCINGDCDNTPGGFKCDCEDGYQIGNDGLECHDVRHQLCWRKWLNGTCMDDITIREMTVEECCNSIGEAWGSVNCRPCSEFPLRCPKGYHYEVETDSCIDINECDIDGCYENATCVNTIGSYLCKCPPHLTLDATGTLCLDLRMEMCYIEYDESTNTCDRPTGKLQRRQTCCCSVGYGWGNPCEGCPVDGSDEFNKLCPDGRGRPGGFPINECLEFPNLCENGKCENTDGSYECVCNNGFALDESETACVDIDECTISPHICGFGVCRNSDGSFICDCDVGYALSPSGNTCENRDECMDGGRCTGGVCVDTDGSYECRCPQGRSLSEDGTHCIDIDECAVFANLCEPNGECINQLGFFRCRCDLGYEPTDDEQGCVDVNECDINNGGCSSMCTNTIGSYECYCDPGFSLSYDGHTCADDDECIEQPNRCDGGRCENLEGTFRCICFDGFMGEEDLQYCSDIDECEMNNNICLNGKCHNTRGSYTCNCDPGYCVPQGQMICLDEDECRLGKHTCDVNADCTNTDGGFECSCIEGFHGDGFDCYDNDECANGNNTCDDNAKCMNTHGGFACDCEEGWHGDGYSCSDVEDCLEDANLCGPHGTCLNVDGGFVCECPMGFMETEDKKACKDIDECTIESICVNGRCTNVPGQFRCLCMDGYVKDDQGVNCTDIDECADVANCVNGDCVNVLGSYECQCPDGFQQNPTGVGCVDVRVGDCYLNVVDDDLAPVCETEIGVAVSRASCCCSYGEGWGNPCEVCPPMNTTEYNTLCPGGPGFKPNPITVLLEDIDECLELPGLCQGGKCVNLFGSFQCICPEGYELNEENRICEDVDECAAVEDICGPGNCTNTVGGYNCLCPTGYIPAEQGRECEDIRESFCYRQYDENSNECSSPVYFNTTKYECCCYAHIGQGWNIPCEICPVEGEAAFRTLCKANELKTDGCKIEGLCKNGVCVSGKDGYVCECSEGYRYDESLLICHDIDECSQENLCHENSVCVNLEGSYRCNCLDGYIFDEDANFCIDVDECLDASFCTNGECENTAGGYECSGCEQGYRINEDGTACEDIVECDGDPCGNGKCHNFIGGFSCDCDNGYEIGANGDCVDTQECLEEGICANGECENSDGGYECVCDDGYKQSDDGRSCLDKNECVDDANVCGDGTCQNMDGSFKCFCPKGYSSPDGQSCEDDDECDLHNMCAYGNCFNTAGSFYCTCPTGFILSDNKQFCIDQRKGLCYADFDGNGQCSGGRPDQVKKSSCCCRCMEAAWGEAGAACEECPVVGSDEFDTLCPHGCGVDPNGRDINECLENNPCVNGKCINTAKSFKCVCKTHYRLDEDGLTCIDIDECLEDACGPGICTNVDGGFNCVCDNGYYNGPDNTCIDVDECAHEAHGCAYKCDNTDGGFECVCPTGYQLQDNRRTCEDIDECAEENLNTCAQKGMRCQNEVGHYRCLCEPGYKKIGVSDECEDIDECKRTNVCKFGICENIEGSFRCSCDEGYDYDEGSKKCIDNRQGYCFTNVHQRMCELTATTGVLTTKSQCCCNTGMGWGEGCELCPNRATQAFVDLCPHGPGFDSEGNDIDDCIVTPNLCSNGTCVNLLGTYKCICDRGFMSTPSMQACVDIDECSGNHGCSGGAVCENEQGSYTCKCEPGYTLTNTRRCVDIDECQTKYGEHSNNCHFLCHNTVGSYSCGCPSGFIIDKQGVACVDVNECADQGDICGANAACINDVGGYHCVCNKGYEKNYNGDGCVGLPCDAAECDEGTFCLNIRDTARCVPGCNGFSFGLKCKDMLDCREPRNYCGYNQVCQQSDGLYRCVCRRGLTQNGPDGRCGDINECRFQRSPCQFGCNNNFGGFRCGCPQSFYGIGGGHCLGGFQGFQQPMQQMPQLPYGMPPPPYGGRFGGGGKKCFSCPPMRYKRSLDAPPVIEASENDEVNASLPVFISINAEELTSRTQLLKLLPALSPLNGNVKYHISAGNDDGMFRMHTKKDLHFVHLSRDAPREHVSGRRITIEAKPSVDETTVRGASLNNLVMEHAMSSIMKFDVEIEVQK